MYIPAKLILWQLLALYVSLVGVSSAAGALSLGPVNSENRYFQHSLVTRDGKEGGDGVILQGSAAGMSIKLMASRQSNQGDQPGASRTQERLPSGTTLPPQDQKETLPTPPSQGETAPLPTYSPREADQGEDTDLGKISTTPPPSTSGKKTTQELPISQPSREEVPEADPPLLPPSRPLPLGTQPTSTLGLPGSTKLPGSETQPRDQPVPSRPTLPPPPPQPATTAPPLAAPVLVPSTSDQEAEEEKEDGGDHLARKVGIGFAVVMASGLVIGLILSTVNRYTSKRRINSDKRRLADIDQQRPGNPFLLFDSGTMEEHQSKAIPQRDSVKYDDYPGSWQSYPEEHFAGQEEYPDPEKWAGGYRGRA